MVISALVGSLFYNNITQAQKGQEPTQVDVVNLPIDEQGNLRTAIVETSKIMLVYNETLTVPSSVSNFIYLTSFNTSGFKYVYVMAKAQGTWEVGRAVIDICVYENNFGIQTLLRIFNLDTTIETFTPSWGTRTTGGEYAIHSTSIDLYLRVHNSNVGFDGLLTIAVSLTN